MILPGGERAKVRLLLPFQGADVGQPDKSGLGRCSPGTGQKGIAAGDWPILAADAAALSFQELL